MSQTNTPLKYAEDYAAMLDVVACDHPDSLSFYEALCNWQQDNSERAKKCINHLNETLSLMGDNQLVPEHPPTTAVGGFKGLVVVSANPGFKIRETQKNNKLADNREEMRIRKTKNLAFCRDFFSSHDSELLNYTQGIQWWQRVGKFAYTLLKGEPAPTEKAALWQWASYGELLGGVDLVPFHSTSDGITPAILKGKKRQEPAASIEAVRRIAKATLKMVINDLQPKIVVVTSKAGSILAQELLTAEGHTGTEMRFECVGKVPLDFKSETKWQDGHIYLPRFYQIDRSGGQSTVILLFPMQLFSNRGGHQSFNQQLAQGIHDSLFGGR